MRLFSLPVRGVALATAAAAAAVWLYWPALRLPLIYDTLLHIRIAGQLDFVSVWLPAEAFGFYRPLTFLPLLIVRSLFGYHPSWLLQGLNVGQHALNAALVVSFVWRLWPGRARRALAAGLLFAFLPFSYQAVAVYGHNVHPATTGLLLLALHAYLWGVERPLRLPWLLCAALFALALFSHESAVLFGPLAALVHWSRDGRPPRRPLRPRQHPWLLFLALGAAYALLYRFLPITRAPQAAAGSAVGLWPALLYLLQAAAYPVTWLAHRLPGWSATTIILGGSAVTLFLVTIALRRRNLRPPLFLGWGWWALASLVIALPLPADYLLHGPRLLYLGSVGLALTWTAMLEGLVPAQRAGEAGSRGRRALAAALWLALLLAILTSGWLFVRGRLADYGRLTEPVRVLQNTMAGQPADVGATFVNLPQWLAPPRNTFALGAESVSMLGGYLFVEELVTENLRAAYPAQAVRLSDLLGQTDYHYAVHDQTPLASLASLAVDQTQHLFVTRYHAAGPQTAHVGWLEPANAAAPPLATFTLYELLVAEVTACDAELLVRLMWRQAAPPPPTTSVFVQLLDDAGRFVAGADGPPLGLPPGLLPPGRRLVDLRRLSPAPGGASILVGVYDYASGQRYPAVDAAGRPLPDDALSLPLGACGSPPG